MNLKGARVLVTGGAGFIGSHLVEELVRRGAHPHVLVHYNALQKAGWLDTSPARSEVKLVFGDVADSDSVVNAVKGCSAIFHLAALIGIPYSYVAPRAYVRTNVEGTLNVLQAARALEIERVIVTSTSEVYGTAQTAPMTESHPLLGQSPYSATKIGADQLAVSFHRSFATPVTVLRPFNTFGPRQSTRAVIPAIISQALANSRLRLGNLDATRDLTFVADTVDGFVRAAEQDAAVGKTIHLGTGVETSVRAIAEMVCKALGKDCEIEVDQSRLRPEASEVNRLIADNSQARKVLGWSPRFDVQTGLLRTIEWFAENADAYRDTSYAI
jgi:NAD dependent epimerase/dehydratase